MAEDNVKLRFVKTSFTTKQELPLAGDGVRAGFPSPAQDYMEDAIDFNRDFIIHPECTFFARCEGDSMEDDGIFDGDFLVIDKLLEPRNNDIVVAVVDGDFTLKRLNIVTERRKKRLFLMPSNPKYDPIEISEYNDFRIWGVLLCTIRDFTGRFK